MTRYIEIARSEFVHLVRSPFKTISLTLFGLAVIYGCQNGYGLFKAHKAVSYTHLTLPTTPYV